MTSPDVPPQTVAGLLAALEATRASIEAAIANVEEAHLVAPGPSGWSVKDHLSHLGMWDSTGLAALEGIHPADRLGVDREIWDAQADDDRINDTLLEITAELSWEEAVALWRDVRKEVIAAISGRPLADFQRTFDEYVPGVVAIGDTTIWDWMSGHAAYHDPDHLAMIEALVADE